MDNPIIESPKLEDEEEEVTVKDEPEVTAKDEEEVTVKDEPEVTAKDEEEVTVKDEEQVTAKDEEEVTVKDEEQVAVTDAVQEPEIIAASESPPPIIDYEAKKVARDAKAKRKDEKTVQQVLKTLDSLKTPEEKLSAMCKKYSELLHENRQLQGTVKQSEKNITMIHREKEQFRHERSKAVLAKTRMEQLCRELQKLNKAQQEETALKLRVEEEKRKEICITFQSAFAEMNTLTNQNNEKSAKMREENLEMREKIKSVRERIELTETQLDKVRQQAKLELELAREKLVRVTLELTAEKKALMEDKRQLLMKLAKYHVRVKEHEGTEQFLRKQIKMYEEKFEEFKKDVKKTAESLKNFRPESREMKKKMRKLEKETAVWKQRWEKTNSTVLQITEIKEKRDAEMVTLNNKLSTLQELCKVFQRERTSLLAQLREKNDAGVQSTERKLQQTLTPNSNENRKSLEQVETISKDCEKLKDNLSKLEGSFSEVVREAVKSTVFEEEAAAAETPKANKKVNRKTKKNEARGKTNQKKEEKTPDDNQLQNSVESKSSGNESPKEVDQTINDQSEISLLAEDKLETSAEEIAILERHETVLKDIEIVLAEQAILEAKIACVKEIGKSITDVDIDCPASEIPLSDHKLVEISPTESPQEEVETAEAATAEGSSSSVHRETTNHPENKTAEDDSVFSITEFEIVDHGSCVPDIAASVKEVDNEKVSDQTELPSTISIPEDARLAKPAEKHQECLSEEGAACDFSDQSGNAAPPETTPEKIIVA